MMLDLASELREIGTLGSFGAGQRQRGAVAVGESTPSSPNLPGMPRGGEPCEGRCSVALQASPHRIPPVRVVTFCDQLSHFAGLPAKPAGTIVRE